MIIKKKRNPRYAIYRINRNRNIVKRKWGEGIGIKEGGKILLAFFLKIELTRR